MIIASRDLAWDKTHLLDFITVLIVSSFIAVTGAMLLKLLNTTLHKLTLRASLFSAYLLLILATFLVFHALDFVVREHLPELPHFSWEPVHLLQIFLISSVSYAIVLAFILRRSKNAALIQSTRSANLQALQSRIRPHFMFNSMNSIASLIRNNPELAEQALEDLADLVRVLMADARKLVPLSAEIQTCKQYLKIEKLRLGERLGVQWHMNRVPKNCFVPSLVLQPLLENAVYHGIEPNFGGGVIDIDLGASNNKVHILIRNPLSDEGGQAHRKGNQIAMDNIRARLSKHFGDEASLSSTRRNEMHITKIVFPVVTGR
jgi:two-component system sensor histidine kinase AlgZ